MVQVENIENRRRNHKNKLGSYSKNYKRRVLENQIIWQIIKNQTMVQMISSNN